MNPATPRDEIRACTFVSPGAPLEMRRFRPPVLQVGEALVQIDCCTICGSDLHTYLGKRHGPAPSILGHEALGRIAALGPGKATDNSGKDLAVGDRVSWAVAKNCGNCFFCRHELPQKCEHLFKYGHQDCCDDHPLSGGLAEYCHLAEGTAVFRVPECIPDAVASSANCATATVMAARRAAAGFAGKTVLVQGAGLLGLTTTAIARVDGAKEIIVTDVDPKRIALAASFGATKAIDVSERPEELNSYIQEVTAGRGVDLAMEMCGAADAVRQGLGVLRTGGHYVLVGAVRPIGLIEIDVEQVVRHMWCIQGIHNYAPVDLATALGFLAENYSSFPFSKLIEATFSLDEADVAFQHMHRTGAIRVAIVPRQG